MRFAFVLIHMNSFCTTIFSTTSLRDSFLQKGVFSIQPERRLFSLLCFRSCSLPMLPFSGWFWAKQFDEYGVRPVHALL